MPNNLRQLRRNVHLTQADLAARSGIRQATLSALENGHASPQHSTILALASALGTTPGVISESLKHSRADSEEIEPIEQMATPDWPFLAGLDLDLRRGLATSLVAKWTHSSTALEGNTITAGDTLFVLTEGLTISGKSLREHQEIHGHAQALGLMASWTRARKPIRIEQLHQLHRAVMSGAPIDSLSPVGAWKNESNGTNAITSTGETKWHDYAEPKHVPALIESWLKMLAQARRNPQLKSKADTRELLLQAYTDIHLGFAAIHPYADGNGRMARLLANIPLLQAGHPPLLVEVAQRREYITLLGDYSLGRGAPKPGDEAPVDKNGNRAALHDFFETQWRGTLDLITEFRDRQSKR